MSNKNCEFCGKLRFDINWTNWKRHTNACAKKKLKLYTETSETISKNTKTPYSRPEKKISMYFQANVKVSRYLTNRYHILMQ